LESTTLILGGWLFSAAEELFVDLAFAGVLFFAMGIILVLRRGAAKRLIRYRSIENVKLR
jgi:hypothetical protein